MPDIQELIALGIVALVAGRLIYRYVVRRNVARRSACGDCASAGPPKPEATVHFYRRRDSGPKER